MELFGNLILLCDFVLFLIFLLVVLILICGIDFKCYWNFSDGYVVEMKFVDYGLIYKLKWIFNVMGLYLFYVSCENRLSRVNVILLVIV